MYYVLIGLGDINVVMIYGVSGNLCDLKIVLGVWVVEKYCVFFVDWFGFGWFERFKDGYDFRV